MSAHGMFIEQHRSQDICGYSPYAEEINGPSSFMTSTLRQKVKVHLADQSLMQDEMRMVLVQSHALMQCNAMLMR